MRLRLHLKKIYKSPAGSRTKRGVTSGEQMLLKPDRKSDPDEIALSQKRI